MKKYVIFLFVFFAAVSYAAENKIQGPLCLSYSQHALQRMGERNISKEEVEDAIRRHSYIYHDKRRNNLSFVLHENNTTTRIVTSLKYQHVITAIKSKKEF